MPGPCLAATCHDPRGAFAPGVEASAEVLARVFSSVVVNATAETSPATIDALCRARPDVVLARHSAGSVGIGTARLDAVRLACASGAAHVVHSDLDHVMRWAGVAPAELVDVLGRPPAVDCLVVGRSEAAMAAEPARLRATEGVVNHVFALTAGLDDEWDLMMALRVLSARTAAMLVETCTEDSIANDVVWPLLAARHGHTLGYAAVDGLGFRARDDFGAPADERDGEPLEWIARLATASRHAQAMAAFVGGA